jgi:hypothetical protein
VQPGQPARVHVQVHQRGAGPCRNVRVRVLAVPACLRPPDLPEGAWVLDGDPPPGSPWRAVGPPVAVGDLEPGRSAVASLDWEVPTDLPREVCLLAVAAAGSKGLWTTGSEGLWTSGGPAAAAGLRSPSGGLGSGGRGFGVGGNRPWGLKSLTVLGPAGGSRAGRGAGPRVVRLDLWGVAGQGPFTLAAEPWLARATAGVVLGRGLGAVARAAGMAPGRVGAAWRPELVTLVQEDPGLAERLDLGAVFPVPGAHGDAVVAWLQGMELGPDRPEPMLLLVDEPPASGRGSLLLLAAGGGVLGGHTFQVPG